MKKKIAILGATGRTGRWVVEEALHRGYAVNVLVRTKSRLLVRHEDLTVIEGTPALSKDLVTTLNGCVAVLSALNISRSKEWWPWSKLSASETFLSDVARELVNVMTSMKIRRVLVVTAWGTSESRSRLPGWFRFMISTSKIGVTYRDHERQERVWESSGLDWTIVRPVGLTNGARSKPIEVWTGNESKNPRLTISRRQVANFMLDALEQGSYICQKPIVAYR